MELNLQPILENKIVALYPLVKADFNELYKVASDPKIWIQHPNKDRWQRDVFKHFFDEAIIGNGAYKILFKPTGKIVGSTRFYGYNELEKSVSIGYTFLSTYYWGKGINHMIKVMMLDYIFQFVSRVYFHIGAENIRSQKAISRLGVKKIGENVLKKGETFSKINYIYSIEKSQWTSK